jgi:hypothetical protein
MPNHVQILESQARPMTTLGPSLLTFLTNVFWVPYRAHVMHDNYPKNLQIYSSMVIPRIMPRSHQTFRLVSTVKLLGTMFRFRYWPTIFYTIIARDADGWCLNWPVWSAPHSSVFNHPCGHLQPCGIVHMMDPSVISLSWVKIANQDQRVWNR